MARVSRKKLQSSEYEKKQKPQYNTAIYARLSIEEEEKQDSSIRNQILIARDYVEKHDDLSFIKTYIDNGQTGTNFDRPGFAHLMKDLNRGKVNCVIVKDLSRFGRNYLETGRLLETVFPYMGIRFISVNDNFDSNYCDDNGEIMISLKGILHDHYAKDISKKVSTAIAVKKKSGKFMNRIPPYGYGISPKNKYQLEIQQEQAEVVRSIFRWRIEGMGCAAIARRLNDMEVPSYFKLRYMQGFGDGKKTALWHGSTVMGILKNPIYLGCLVERKTEKAFYKGGGLLTLPQDEWNLIQKTHEPIISKMIFDEVQSKWKQEKDVPKSETRYTSPKEKSENVFQGMLICGECGCVLQRNSGYYHQDGTLISHYYYCPRRYIKEGGCKSRPVSEKVLKEVVLESCKRQFALIGEEIYALSEEKMPRSRDSKKKGSFNPNDWSYEKKEEINNIPQTKEWMKNINRLKNPEGLTKEFCKFFLKQIVIKNNFYSIHYAHQAEWEGLIGDIN